MKCPECGFDCLPDDVECLACGVDIAAAVKNKEKERLRSIEAAERKAKYDIEIKKELGLIPEDDDVKKSSPEKESKNASTLEDTFKQKPKCPKCGAERHPDSPECLRCGVIFEKLNGGGVSSDEIKEKYPAETAPGQTEVRPEDKTKEIDLNDLEVKDKDDHEPSVDVDEKDPGQQMLLEKAPETSKPEIESEQVESSQYIPQPQENKEMPQPEEASVSSQPEGKADASQPVVKAETPQTEPDEPAQTDGVERNATTEEQSVVVDSEKTDIVSLKHMGPQKNRLGNIKQKITETYIRYEPQLKKAKTNLMVLLKDKRTSWVAAGLGLIVIISIFTTFGITYFKQAKIDRLQREHAEKLEKIRSDYIAGKLDIDQKIRTLISNKLFDNAEKEIALYDISALQNELQPLKIYLKEIRLLEKAKKIPGADFENNYLAYLELMGLNPDNEIYRKKTAIYKKRWADANYSKAKAYLGSKKKNANELAKAMASIDKSLELFPGSDAYAKIKRKLMIENLLYYEGNNNIVMAVRDDGMGKKLYSNQRKLTIWVKNISSETVYINDQFFTMVGKNNKRYTYNDRGKRFKTKLDPGEQTVGELYFRTRTRPATLMFSHLVSGEISRVFP